MKFKNIIKYASMLLAPLTILSTTIPVVSCSSSNETKGNGTIGDPTVPSEGNEIKGNTINVNFTEEETKMDIYVYAEKGKIAVVNYDSQNNHEWFTRKIKDYNNGDTLDIKFPWEMNNSSSTYNFPPYFQIYYDPGSIKLSDHIKQVSKQLLDKNPEWILSVPYKIVDTPTSSIDLTNSGNTYIYVCNASWIKPQDQGVSIQWGKSMHGDDVDQFVGMETFTNINNNILDKLKLGNNKVTVSFPNGGNVKLNPNLIDKLKTNPNVVYDDK